MSAITDQKLEDWWKLAIRDDALEHFVPSDLRQMIGEIYRLRGRDEPRPHALDLGKEYQSRAGHRVVRLTESPTGYDVRAWCILSGGYEFGYAVRGDGTYGHNRDYDLIPKPSN